MPSWVVFRYFITFLIIFPTDRIFISDLSNFLLIKVVLANMTTSSIAITLGIYLSAYQKHVWGDIYWPEDSSSCRCYWHYRPLLTRKTNGLKSFPIGRHPYDKKNRKKNRPGLRISGSRDRVNCQWLLMKKRSFRRALMELLLADK